MVPRTSMSSFNCAKCVSGTAPWTSWCSVMRRRYLHTVSCPVARLCTGTQQLQQPLARRLRACGCACYTTVAAMLAHAHAHAMQMLRTWQGSVCTCCDAHLHPSSVLLAELHPSIITTPYAILQAAHRPEQGWSVSVGDQAWEHGTTGAEAGWGNNCIGIRLCVSLVG
jgi:hypothetical protein